MSIKVKNHHIKDRMLRATHNLYPAELHENLKLPGVFLKKCELVIITYDNREVEPDIVMFVGPDNETIFENTILILEHQSYVVDKDKIRVMKEYQDNTSYQTHYPVYVMVVTSLDLDKFEKVYARSPSDIFIPGSISLKQGSVTQRLNNLKFHIKNQKQISDVDALDFVLILVFAPPGYDEKLFEEVCSLLKVETTIKGQLRQDIIDLIEKFNGETFDE